MTADGVDTHCPLSPSCKGDTVLLLKDIAVALYFEEIKEKLRLKGFAVSKVHPTNFKKVS